MQFLKWRVIKRCSVSGCTGGYFVPVQFEDGETNAFDSAGKMTNLSNLFLGPDDTGIENLICKSQVRLQVLELTTMVGILLG